MAGDNGLNRAAGAIVGAIVISVALLILSRWELVASGTGMGTNGVYRLDRWTGAIVACAQKNSPPATLDCDSKE
jgi:hypothetical protein